MTTTKDTPLAPCPFCGSKAVALITCHESEPTNAGGRTVVCNGCQTCGPVMFPLKESVDEQLVAAWNRRVVRPAPAEGAYMATFDELVAFETWFYADETHDHYHAFSQPYALAYKAWKAALAQPHRPTLDDGKIRGTSSGPLADSDSQHDEVAK